MITILETIALLSKIKRAYPNFVILTTKNERTGQVITNHTAELWHERLLENGITFEQALRELNRHIDSSSFEPKIADVIPSREELSWHQYQQQEAEQSRLALQAYHENEDVKPMPDYVREQLERIGRKVRGEDS